MKNKSFAYIVLLFVIISVILSCYFYPVTRDEFYYIIPEKLNAFQEYYRAYFTGNPRIGQFFCNLIGRNSFFEILFGGLLFYGFFSVSFLLVYSRKFNLKETADIKKILAIVAFFIINIYYFGEMFFYNPFSTNYTLSVVFYLLYIYIFSRYFIDQEDFFADKKFKFLLILPLGIYTGMCNEHVPPVLLGVGFLGGLYFLVKEKKLPNFTIIAYNVSIFVGYLLLFFAPANKIKYKTLGKTQYSFSLENYLNNYKQIFKIYYYYNPVLVVFVLISIVLLVVLFRNKIYDFKKLLSKIVLLSGLISLAIVAYSPLIGTRLLFFANTLLILFSYSILEDFIKNYFPKITFTAVSYLFLILFFGSSVVIAYNANQNYKMVNQEIEAKSKLGKTVQLEQSYHFETPFYGRFNRMIILDNGNDYIDANLHKDTSTEKLLKSHFGITQISTK